MGHRRPLASGKTHRLTQPREPKFHSVTEVCVKAVRQSARPLHGGIERDGTKISVARGSAMSTGEISIADRLVYARRFRISSDVHPKNSDRVIHTGLIEQYVTKIVEQTLRCRRRVRLG